MRAAKVSGLSHPSFTALPGLGEGQDRLAIVIDMRERRERKASGRQRLSIAATRVSSDRWPTLQARPDA
jgi:hypothetical protein